MATKTIKLNGGSDDIKISSDNLPYSAGNGITISNDEISLVSNYLVRERYSTTVSVGSTPVNWKVSGTKSGYTPIMANLFYNQSSTTVANAEQMSMVNGSFSANGFAKNSVQTSNVTFYVDVLWKKN